MPSRGLINEKGKTCQYSGWNSEVFSLSYMPDEGGLTPNRSVCVFLNARVLCVYDVYGRLRCMHRGCRKPPGPSLSLSVIDPLNKGLWLNPELTALVRWQSAGAKEQAHLPPPSQCCGYRRRQGAHLAGLPTPVMLVHAALPTPVLMLVHAALWIVSPALICALTLFYLNN